MFVRMKIQLFPQEREEGLCASGTRGRVMALRLLPKELLRELQLPWITKAAPICLKLSLRFFDACACSQGTYGQCARFLAQEYTVKH
ncbi:hypothetical protein NDU88_004574 [Pleurodeles waltl]|uniref:Uncharacterized protein n=1 Tax=Pleurodeles waltl TaxID=8319 RepID=A0AAV7UFR4_PLEWA|nr:hypothetical protein NDU88_004574 [Pleurodeles waltl]